MKCQEQALLDLLLIEPTVHHDRRGFFLERYNREDYRKHSIDIEFIQDNHSHSTKHVLRGLHYQLPPFAQDKLVHVVRGEVFDVSVDLRKESPTFGKWQGFVLSEENMRMLLVPRGFAHGFVVLSERADFVYKVSNVYSGEHERGIRWNDQDIGIDWPVDQPILSEKDGELPLMKELVSRGEIF